MKESSSTPITKSMGSADEAEAYGRLLELSRSAPIPENEILANLGLFLTRASFSRMLFMHNLYLKVLPVQGVIVEFGTRWGQNLALFNTFRTMYEPYNFTRTLVGFDTFEGFPSVAPEDGRADVVQSGAYSVTPVYETFLERLMTTQEKLAPRSHIKKFELVKGDVEQTLPAWLKAHPETIIALAYFDMDLYKPTKRALELLRPYLTKGSVVGFDELGHPVFPGETVALKEAWGLGSCRITRDPISTYQSYLVFE